MGSDFVPGFLRCTGRHFNPRSPWGERRRRCKCYAPQKPISIHAPRVGSDSGGCATRRFAEYFNPRSPCGERRYECPVPVCSAAISIHAPRVGSDYFRISGDLGRPISIHAPRVGSDFVTVSKLLPILRFQSTLPVWGATHQGHVRSDRKTISIHAPRVGSDRVMGGFVDDKIDFNPRSPCGERLSPCINCAKVIVFQSTLPVWGATAFDHSRFAATAISIHAPRVGSDPMRSPHFSHPCLFQSTLPVWGATNEDVVFVHKFVFQSTLPVWGATSFSDPTCIWGSDFNPRSPCGERPTL